MRVGPGWGTRLYLAVAAVAALATVAVLLLGGVRTG